MIKKRIILILGDQLDSASPALSEFDFKTDTVLMIESVGEAKYVWSHQSRIALFLSAMRHFAEDLSKQDYPLKYIKESELSLIEELRNQLIQHQATHLVFVTPGEWRLQVELEALGKDLTLNVAMLEDSHFYCSLAEFKSWAGNKKELRMEFFYRHMRKLHDVLLNADDTPIGGQWNFDDLNRSAYGSKGPGLITPPLFFKKDKITADVLEYVEKRYSNHPGSLDQFEWAVTRGQALEALDYFVQFRLSNFGAFQDAMWEDTPFGWHSVISSCLNLKLLNPREVVNRVIKAYEENSNLYSLATVEGFIRQIIGWREFIRGVYYLDMPALAEQNYYGHQRALPSWYWTGETKMNCMRDAIAQTLKYGYAHHIQRLMLTGNFAVLSELLPKQVSEWYLAVYVDAVEWVEMPNVLGMALFANGGRFTSKPYIASGAYVNRMSNYCNQCAYKPKIQFGDNACPFTTLYWNFLLKHQDEFDKNPRTKLMVSHAKKMTTDQIVSIRAHADFLLTNIENI